MRNLTPDEIHVIREIASRLPATERDQLLRDANDATAEVVAGKMSRVIFTIAGYERPPYHGQHPFLVEGSVQDRDGSMLTVLLHADENNRLFELELVRFEEGEVIEPDWSTLILF